MPKLPSKPSEFLPSYLKLDLNVGVPEVHPFVAALDETIEGWGASAQCEALSMTRSHFPLERKRSLLEGYGLQLASLTEDEMDRCYHELHRLFRNQGALTAVTILAEIYFPKQDVQVRRGRGLRRQPLKGALTFPIIAADRDSDDRLVLVTLSQSTSVVRKQEFTANASRFIPHGFQILIKEPTQGEAEEAGRFDLGGSIRLTERRI